MSTCCAHLALARMLDWRLLVSRHVRLISARLDGAGGSLLLLLILIDLLCLCRLRGLCRLRRLCRLSRRLRALARDRQLHRQDVSVRIEAASCRNTCAVEAAMMTLHHQRATGACIACAYQPARKCNTCAPSYTRDCHIRQCCGTAACATATRVRTCLATASWSTRLTPDVFATVAVDPVTAEPECCAAGRVAPPCRGGLAGRAGSRRLEARCFGRPAVAAAAHCGHHHIPQGVPDAGIQDACIAALAGVGTSGFLTILLLSWYSALQRRDIGSKRCSVRRCAAAFVHVASVGSPRWAMLAKQVMLEEAARDMARHRVLDTIGEQRLRSET